MKKYIGPLLLLITALIWGFAFPFQKEAAEIPPMTLNAVRSFVAVLFLLPMIPVMDRVRHTGRRLFVGGRLDFTRREWIGGALCGLVLSAASSLQQLGFHEGADAGKTAFLTALYVVIVPLLGLFLGKRVGARLWVSIGIAVGGFWLLCIKDGFTIASSDLILLLCALVCALHILTVDHFIGGCDGVRMSTLQFFFVFLFTGVMGLLVEGVPDLSLIAEHVFPLLYLGVGSSGIAYTLQILGQRSTNHALASVLMSLESVFGALGGALVLGEVMTPKEYLGCAVVFIAVLIAEVEIPIRKKQNAIEKTQ